MYILVYLDNYYLDNIFVLEITRIILVHITKRTFLCALCNDTLNLNVNVIA